MGFKSAAFLSSLLALPLTTVAQSSETVLGVYIFHRHGDRTAKATPPANLTDLGYREVYERGQYYRSRYVASDATNPISGLNTDVVRLAQLAVTAPVDNVLQSSAAGFVQGLYPAAGNAASQTLRNGTSVEPPLGGFQIIPINIVSNGGAGSEDNGWLQDASSCANAETSSNNYFNSAQYQSLLKSTQSFYDRLDPVVNGSFSAAQTSFKNAYTIFDLINVAEIHNRTINSSNLLDTPTLFQLRTLADSHEYGLAYNASDDMRAIAGMQLAGEILDYLNSSITSFAKHNNKLGIQFGAYGTFFSFFGLANLTEASPNFFGVPDYASSMVFELVTTADVSKGAPSQDQINVRFLYHNGTSDNKTEPTAFPLFGQKSETVSWPDFVSNMSGISVTTTQEWCTKCGNFTGTCAAFAPSSGSSSSDSGSSSSGGGSHISTAVGGVIGAMVTLGVILGVEALILLLGGLRLVSKSRLAGAGVPNGAGTGAAVKA
ncbi:phosphoglycerate mutase-like protein [Rhizodiscina lignyota]|uniref:Phosphoglycerate mutase-like protein n=1 Tax=Rhizodiscina lignyota TaxID=1504668 RepID=A0A9P4I2X7_9PEZI|nr:phosphoglycerate mutase-like protein [Rhizodiscina lignyota]